MANHPPPDGTNDDFFDQIFSIPSSFAASAADAGTLPFGGDSSTASGGEGPSIFSLGLSLDQQHGNPNHKDICGNRIREEDRNSSEAEREHPTVQLASLFPPYGHNSSIQQIRPNPTAQALHVQAMQNTMAVVPQPPPPRPRVRARRGQATDPHSIAERLRRERIAERIRALQELVPSTNKTDRAAMLDEIVDYVKFLRLQVKVLSMSRLGGAGAVAQLVADIPLSLVEGDSGESKATHHHHHHVWEKWTTDGTERQVAKLMGEDVGAAMQFLQSKALCIMPISLAAAIYQVHSQAESPSIKPEPDTPS